MRLKIRPGFAAETIGLVASFAFLFALECVCPAQTEHERIELLDLIRVGNSSDEIAKTINRLFVAVQTNRYLPRYPFRELIPYTNNAVVSEWRSKEEEGDGWPEIVFAVFSDERKTNLVDALWFKAQNIRPLVDGLYSQRLGGVKAGDSVTKLYGELGRRECTYFLAKDGKWRVRFFYWGYEGKMIHIEADAGSGLILKVSDSTI